MRTKIYLQSSPDPRSQDENICRELQLVSDGLESDVERGGRGGVVEGGGARLVRLVAAAAAEADGEWRRRRSWD